MKRTFQQNDCIHAPHPAMQKALIDYAVSKGVPVFEGTIKELDCRHDSQIKSWPNLNFNKGELTGSCEDSNIEISQFYEYCDNWQACQPVEVKLNDSYTAKINAQHKTVTVGRQTFTAEKVIELAEKVKTELYKLIP